MATKREMQMGVAGLGNLAGLYLAYRAGKGFWGFLGYSITGGILGGTLGLAIGNLTGSPDPDKVVPQLAARTPPLLLPAARPENLSGLDPSQW